MITLSVQRELRRARREWLHTNGAGAYASSTIAGMHTRRHHGLLVAEPDPNGHAAAGPHAPRGHHVFLSHVDITVTLARAPDGGGRRPKWELAKHQFPGVDPQVGPFYLERFEQAPLPRWTHAVAGGELEVTLGLVRGENALVLRYAFRGPEPVVLGLRPLLATRDFQRLQREHGGMIQRVELRPGHEGGGASREPGAGEMRVQPRRDLPRICFRYEGTFVGSPDWWRRFEYLNDHALGLDYQEDLWTPGIFEVPLDEGAPRYLVAAVDKLPAGEPDALLEGAGAALLAGDPAHEAPLLPRVAWDLADDDD